MTWRVGRYRNCSSGGGCAAANRSGSAGRQPNLAGERGRYGAHLEKLRKGPVLLVPVEADGNVLVFAFAQPASMWTLESVEARAEELQSDLALEFPRFLQRLRTGHLL